MQDFLFHKRLLLLAFTAMAVVLCQHLHAQVAGAQVVVIANPTVAAAAISRADLRDVFTGASTSVRGASRIVPILLKDGAIHEEMLTFYIGKSDAAFRATWRSLIFSGQGVLPKSVDTETSVVDFVAHTPGAIGYIGKATPHEGVKTLVVH